MCCVLDRTTNTDISLFSFSTHSSEPVVFAADVCPASVPLGYTSNLIYCKCKCRIVWYNTVTIFPASSLHYALYFLCTVTRNMSTHIHMLSLFLSLSLSLSCIHTHTYAHHPDLLLSISQSILHHDQLPRRSQSCIGQNRAWHYCSC